MDLIKQIDHRQIMLALLSMGFLCLGGAVYSAQAADAMNGVAASGVPGAAVASAETEEQAKAGKVYVSVNGTPIMVREYNKELFVLLKNRFYHGKVPEGQEEVVRKELTDTMVDHVLLLQDAAQRGLKADEARIEELIAEADNKYSNKPGWKEQREQLLAELRALMREKDLTDQVEKVVKNVPEPTPAEVREYYERHMDLFTEPEKLRLSVILLKVDPSLPVEAWTKTYDEAAKLVDKIKGGADFAEMARKYSRDKTAKNGGDMGYLHLGMLPVVIQDGVGKFKVGEVSAPYKGLEGISIFRLEDRLDARKMEFQQVEQRAAALLLRDRKDQAWKSNLERLRNTAKIEVVTQAIILPAAKSSGSEK